MIIRPYAVRVGVGLRRLGTSKGPEAGRMIIRPYAVRVGVGHRRLGTGKGPEAGRTGWRCGWRGWGRFETCPYVVREGWTGAMVWPGDAGVRRA